MTNNASRQQLSAADDERDSGAEAVGSLTVTTLTLNGGTIYDWEIADFSPGTSNGTAYDVLKYSSITFDSGQKIGVNILAKIFTPIFCPLSNVIELYLSTS